MSGNNGKISVGRARGHSMYSTLKATSDYQAAVGELQVDHAGISAEHLRKNASLEFTRGSVTQKAKTSLLTVALQTAGKSSPLYFDASSNLPYRTRHCYIRAD
jgi:hypothetical protein